MSNTMGRRWLVLSGGASYGAYQVGALEAFAEAGLEFDGIVGTSVGALNGALASTCDGLGEAVETLSGIWGAIRNEDVYESWWPRWLGPLKYIPALWKGSAYNAAPLRRLIHERYDPDEERVPMHAVVCDMRSGRVHAPQLGPLGRGCAEKVVYASAAFPLGFDPIEIDGYGLCTDGGAKEVTPLRHAIRGGVSEIWVVMCPSTYASTWEDAGGVKLVRHALRFLDMQMTENVEEDVRRCTRITKRVRTGQDLVHTPIDVRLVRPALPLAGSSLNFDEGDIQINMRHGLLDGRKAVRTSQKVEER